MKEESTSHNPLSLRICCSLRPLQNHHSLKKRVDKTSLPVIGFKPLGHQQFSGLCFDDSQDPRRPTINRAVLDKVAARERSSGDLAMQRMATRPELTPRSLP